VSGGFGSGVTVETDPKLKQRLGGLAYAITGISHFAELSENQGLFRADGFSWEGHFLALAIGNGRQAGGGIPLCPNALIDDGLLDLMILPAMDHATRMDAFSHLLREGASGIRAKHFITLQRFGWLDSYWALIAPFTASAFGTFLLRQAFLAVPEALEDAARLDGCTGLAFLWHFLLPLSRPTVLAFALVALVAHWNDYFWPLIVTNRDAIRTLPIGLAMFVTQEVTTDWNLLMAATLFVAAPMLVIFFVFQRYFIRSHMHAGLKR
jgi:hypothetical protein